MSEVASAYVTLIPSAKGFGAATSRQISGSMQQAGQDGGKQFGNGLRGAIPGAVAVAGVAAGAAVVAAFLSAVNASAVTAKLGAQLGLGGPETKKVGELAGKIYVGGFGSSLEEVSTAVRGVYQQIGTGNDKWVKEVSSGVLTVADTFDQDLGSVVTSVGQLIKTGLAKDAKQGLDVLTKGFQAGVDKSGDFLDTLNEYGTQFRKFGLDGATATGLLSQGLRAGARDSDIVADAIKEFSIRAIDGSKLTVSGFKAIGLNAKTMQERIAAGGPGAAAALDLTLDKLRGIKDPSDRSAAAVALFGTQAEDLGSALFALDVSSATKQMGNFQGATQKVADTVGGTTAAKLEVFKRQISSGLSQSLSVAIGFAQKFGRDFSAGVGAGGKVKEIVDAAAASIRGFIDEVRSGQGVGGAFATAVALIGGALATIGQLAANNLGLIAALAGVFITARIALVGYRAVMTGVAAAQGAYATATGIVTGVQKAASAAALGTRIQLGLLAIQQKAAAIASKALAAGQWLVNAAMSANPIGIVVLAVAALIAIIVVAYKKNETFRKIVDAAWKGIKTAVSAVVNWFKTAVPAAWNSVKSQTASTWAAISGVVKFTVAVIRAVISTYIRIWSTIISTGLSVIRKVFSLAWSGVTAVVRGAVNLVRGYLSLLSSALGLAGRAASAVGSAIRTGFSAALSAVRSGVGSIISTVGTIRSRVTGAFSSFGSLLVSAGQRLIQGLIDGVLSKVAAVKSAVGSVAGAVKGFFPGSPVKEGPLTSWNNGGAGKRLISQGLIAGIDSQRAAVRASILDVAQGVLVPGQAFSSEVTGSGIASSGIGQSGPLVQITGPVHVRDEDEMARRFIQRGQDAINAFGLASLGLAS